jgi:hypothetical protein
MIVVSMEEEIFMMPNKKGIVIRFDKIFPMNENFNVNEFIIKKRSYNNISNLVIDSLRNIFEHCPYIALYYVKIAIKLNQVKETIEENSITDENFNCQSLYTEDEVIDDIIAMLEIESVFNYINNYIDENYHDNLDEASKKSKKVNEELQFTDDHAKIILKSSECMKIIIPLALEYCDIMNYDDVTDFLYDLFSQVMEIFKIKDINIMNKLHRFIYSRLMSTQYSDSVIWSKLNSQSRDVNIYTNEFFKELIISIFPKIDINQSIVSFLHVVIKQKIQFEFIKKYKIDFKPIDINQVDSDGISEFEKMDINLTKINEGKSIINKLTIKNELKKMTNYFGEIGRITTDELNYYKQFIHINNIQTKLTFNFYSKIIGSYNSLYNASKDEYVKLVVIFHKWLKSKDLNYLAKLVIAKPEKVNDRMRVKNSKGAIIDKVLNSTDYESILKNKYSLTQDKINDNDIIIKMVGEIITSKFTCLKEYSEETKDLTVNEVFSETLPDKMEDVFSELITLIRYF